MIKQSSNRQPTSYLSTLLLQLYISVYSLCNSTKDNQWVEYLRTFSSSTAPLPFLLEWRSKSSFTSCKLQFLRSVCTQLPVARDDLEQILAPVRL